MRPLTLLVVFPCLSLADDFKYLFNIGGRGVNTSWDLPSSIVQNKIVLFTTYFGRYPCIGCSDQKGTGKWCNGGLPQLANWTLHRDKVARDLPRLVPDKTYDGTKPLASSNHSYTRDGNTILHALLQATSSWTMSRGRCHGSVPEHFIKTHRSLYLLRECRQEPLAKQ